MPSYARFALLTLLLLCFNPTVSAQDGICAKYTGSACREFVPSDYVFWVNETADIARQEEKMGFVREQIKVLKPIDPKCYQTFLVYSCTTYFPHCSPFLNNTPQWQCKSDCLAAQDACRSIFTVGGHPEDLPKCDQVPNGAPDHTPYPEKNCYSLGNNTDKGPIECPAPLIRNPFNGTRVPLTCPAYGGQCCFPCPVYHNLYPTTPGAKWEEDLVAKLNAVSVVLLLVVLGLWMGRPGILASSRTATVLFSLLNALGLALLSSGILLFKRDEMMCANPVEDSTGGFWCTLEGLGYAFFGQAFSFSEALFNVNLFLTLHYLRDPIPVSLAYKLFAAIWVVAAGLNTLPYAISGSSHQFGIHCSPKNLHLYRNLSLMPLIAGLVVSIVLGFVNVGYVAKMGWDLHIRGEGGGGVALNESGVDEPETEPETEGEAEDSELVASTRASGDKESGNPRLDTFRQSWRTSILSFLVANAFLVFTIWWFLDAEPALLSGSGDLASGAREWGREWLTCLLRESPFGQDKCAGIPEKHVPRFEWVATTDVMASIVGIFYFVTLGTQPGDWLRLSALSITKLEEARAWLNGKLGRGEIRLE